MLFRSEMFDKSRDSEEKLSFPVDVFAKAVQAHRNAKDLASANKFAAEGLKNFPGNALLLSEFAWNAQNAGDYELAANLLEQIIDGSSAVAEKIYFRYISVLLADEKNEKAVKAFSFARKKYSDGEKINALGKYFAPASSPEDGWDFKVLETQAIHLRNSSRKKTVVPEVTEIPALKFVSDFPETEFPGYRDAAGLRALVKRLHETGNYEIADLYSVGSNALIDEAQHGFDVLNSFKLINNGPGRPLVICFQGFNSKLVKNLVVNDFRDLEKLNYLPLSFSMQRLPEAWSEYNFLFVKDNFQLWYLHLLANYVFHIRRMIAECMPSHVVCMGQSAGGFAALNFGQIIGANLTVAVSPRTVAFQTSMNAYRLKLKELSNLDLHSYSNQPARVIMRGGLKSKVKIIACKHMPVDKEYAEGFAPGDPYLDCILLDCASHNPFVDIGKEKLFNKIKGYIENSLNNF